AHADQHPFAPESRTLELEPESAVLQHFQRRTLPFRLPIAAVPQLHRAATVLPLGDRALEVPVIEWMVLDLDREALDPRIEGRFPCDCPRLEYSIELEPQVIVQAAGGVLLDHEAQMIRARHLALAARLARLAEVPLRPISRESSSGHGYSLSTTSTALCTPYHTPPSATVIASPLTPPAASLH